MAAAPLLLLAADDDLTYIANLFRPPGRPENNKESTLSMRGCSFAYGAVLVAIAIPIFTTQLEKSRDSVSVSNIRAAYAEASSAYLTSNGKDEKAGRVSVTAASKTAIVTGVELKGTQNGWSNLTGELPFGGVNPGGSADAALSVVLTDAIGGTPGTYTLTFDFTSDTCRLKTVAKQS